MNPAVGSVFAAGGDAWDNDRNNVSCKEGQKPGKDRAHAFLQFGVALWLLLFHWFGSLWPSLKDNGWCAEQWCYVDPCNCDLDEPATKAEHRVAGETDW